jgi:hypothetical protein
MSIYDNAGVVLIPSGTNEGTLYSVLPANGDGDFTHDRNLTTATRVNKDGFIEGVAADVPRLNYPLIDGVVQDCPHLLLEPLRRNIALHSGDINNSAWLKQRITITNNSVVAPDGNVSGDLVIGNGTGTSYFYDGFSVVSGTTYTISIFAKQADRKRFYINNFTSAGSIYFDLELGQIDTAATGAFSGGKIEYYGNGWYRCSVQFTATITGNNNIGFVGDNYNGNMFYVWGAQIEDGGSGVDADYISSYIPTTTSAVTRSQDFCNNSGTSADINSEEGVLFAELASLDKNDTSSRRISISDSTTNNVIRLTYDVTSNRLYAVVYKSGTIWATYTALINSEDFDKVALKYKPSDFDFYVNGVKVQQQSSGATFDAGTMSEVAFDNGSGGNLFYGKIKQLMTFKTALTDSELETLTSWDSFNAMAKGQLYTIE